jgi:acetyl-CoA C-acetyltransferase
MTPVISGFARTPFGRFGGALSKLSGPQLGATAIDLVLDSAQIEPAAVEAAYLGVGMIGAATLTPARQAVLMSQLPQETPSLAVDRACCSGMTAVGLAMKDIAAGEASVVLAGGLESLSRTPHLLPRERGKALGGIVLDDPLLMRAPVVDSSIAGYTSREAARHGIDRAMQDAWALESHRRYFAAEAESYFDLERRAVSVEGGSVAADEAPRRDTSLDRLAALKTVHGSETITAGNAPGLSDGAAALIVTSADHAPARWPRCLLRGYTQVSEGPTSGSFTPAIAIMKLLRRHGLGIADVDLIEINEAFAATPLVSTLRLAEGDHKAAEALRRKTNVHGGAVAIGHPLGATGARLVMTLVNALTRRGGGRGVAAICGGFGQGDAVLVEVS